MLLLHIQLGQMFLDHPPGPLVKAADPGLIRTGDHISPAVHHVDGYKITGVGFVAGCYVTDGKVARNAQIRLVRDGIVIHEGVMNSLQRFKDSVKEVARGYECGIGIEKYSDIKEGDIIEAFVMEQIEV